jgi:hypothetical protein
VHDPEDRADPHNIRDLLNVAGFSLCATAGIWLFAQVIPMLYLLLIPVGLFVPPLVFLIAVYAFFAIDALRGRAALLALASIALMAIYYGTFRNLGGA